jgi:hypothetical protein
VASAGYVPYGIEYRPSKYLGVRHLEFTQLRKSRLKLYTRSTVQ